MGLSEELENIHKYLFTSMGLSVPANDFEARKQQLATSTNKLVDASINQQIFDILQEQLKTIKQSLDHVYNAKKQQPMKSSISESPTPAEELPNDNKELQDQVRDDGCENGQRSCMSVFRSLNCVRC